MTTCVAMEKLFTMNRFLRFFLGKNYNFRGSSSQDKSAPTSRPPLVKVKSSYRRLINKFRKFVGKLRLLYLRRYWDRASFICCGLIYVLLWKCKLKTVLLLGEKISSRYSFTILPPTRFTYYLAEGFLLLYDGLARIITLGFYQPDMHYRYTCWLRSCAYGFLDCLGPEGLWTASPITMEKREERAARF
jgi:hypothetical protein